MWLRGPPKQEWIQPGCCENFYSIPPLFPHSEKTITSRALMIRPMKALYHNSTLGIEVPPQIVSGSSRPPTNSAKSWKKTYSDHKNQNCLSLAGELKQMWSSSTHWKLIANVACLESHSQEKSCGTERPPVFQLHYSKGISQRLSPESQ